MMVIDNKILDELLEEAKRSPRLRMNRDMRTSQNDGSQRMLNALLPGTPMPIHRHRRTTETVIVLRGSMTEVFYDNEGVECGRFDLSPSTGSYGLQIPVGQWHTLIVHEPTVIFECKDGPYEPQTAEDVWSMEM